MINTEIMRQILTQYRTDFLEWWEQKDEKYKWIAVEHFQKNWRIDAENFGEMFKEATKEAGNLLNSNKNFPGKMIGDFAKFDDNATREMFRALFDESKALPARVKDFQTAAEKMRTLHNVGRPADEIWKNHFQNTNAISTYLWLCFPKKYYIYKFSVARTAAETLSFAPVPKADGKVESMMAGYQLYDEIRAAIKVDDSVCKLFRDAVKATPGCYDDEEYVTAAIDVAYYIENRVSAWGSYSPNLSVENWSELLNDETVFTESSLQIMKRMLDYGGEATCKQLSDKYGEDPNFYNAGSSALARRVWDKTQCNLMRNEDENTKWWPILYLGKKADKTAAGTFVWILRDELREALEHTDLSSVKLYADGFEPDTPENADAGAENPAGYWWLTANPGIWSFSSLKTGEEQNYTLCNERGNKRRIYQNFLNVKAGDPVICYEARPAKRIVALGQITRENDGSVIWFRKTEGLTSPVELADLKECPELSDMEFFKGRGSLYKLTKDEYDFIMDMIRDSNPLSANKTLHPYSKQNFLKEVFLDEKSYDDLNGLLLHNKNVILQGPPGVGKTFAAKRLAYSIMGERDDSRIEFVQFHQNYSYEDFVMGYRPKENGFELKYGVFYRFCQKAANDPDHKYFFIIDEINRGNVSKIFGELLMLIEKDKRMKFKADENAENYSATLAYTEERFSVPENVHIIGMMNTADRSLAIIDYALRRRFSFFDMSPAFDCAGFREKLDAAGNLKFKSLIERIKALNEEIEKDSSLGAGFRIGHSYFCFATTEDVTDEWLRSIVDYEIVPLLQEYWFDDREKSENWKKTLKNVLNPGEGSSSASTGTASGGNSEPTAEQ